MKRLGFLVLACMGCGSVQQSAPDAAGEPAPPPLPVPGDVPLSGSRIKVRAYTTGDGFKSLQSWIDSQLQVPCAWLDTADGKRCIPSAQYASNTFADAACTRPVLPFAASACLPTPPKYVTTLQQ